MTIAPAAKEGVAASREELVFLLGYSAGLISALLDQPAGHIQPELRLRARAFTVYQKEAATR